MKIGPSVDVPSSRCPHCGARQNAAFGVGNDGKPAIGDVSLCIKCANWMVYGPNLELLEPGPQLLAEIETNKNCQLARRAAIAYSQEQAEKN